MAMLRAAAPVFASACGKVLLRPASVGQANRLLTVHASTAARPAAPTFDLLTTMMMAIPKPTPARAAAVVAPVSGDVPVLAMWATTTPLEAKINTRKPKRANKGSRPCSSVRRRQRYRDAQKAK